MVSVRLSRHRFADRRADLVLGDTCAFIHDEYKRSSIVVQPGHIYASRHVRANGDRARTDEQRFETIEFWLRID